jgi:chlorobactene glucosyltransferase
VTLLSCWPKLELKSFWERALLPTLNFVVFTLYPAPLSLVRGDVSLGLAHGACLLARRSAYRAVGGHQVVRDQIMEDVRLARVWRAAGERALCLDGRGVVRVRMYRTFGEIWRGFQKNFYAGFRREASFWAFLALRVAVFLAPFVVAPLATTSRAGQVLLAAAGCIVAARVALAVRFGNPIWPILLHPFCEVLLVALGVSSWWRCRRGRGVEWKGRRYRASLS